VPELPDVEAARREIEARALRRRIAEVYDGDTYVSRPHAPGEIAEALTGRELVAVHRQGKAMWCETSDDGPILGLHLGMAGRIAIDEEPSERGWDRFVLRFKDGGTLALRDRRRLGRARLEPDIDALGPDAADVERDTFRELIGRGRAPIKARLMDQAVISGIGNLMADEVLWRARIDPRRPAEDLATDELDRLRREMRTVIRMSLRRGHAGVSEVIPERRRDGHCPRCGTAMARATVGGRTTYWCPKEQR
jgi:formamidopyrimidine-DNA glycosylase